MAIDSRNKRASTLGRGLRFLSRLPAPDGTIDAGDRVQTLWLYRGFASDTPVIIYEGLAHITAVALYPRLSASPLYPRITAVAVEEDS